MAKNLISPGISPIAGGTIAIPQNTSPVGFVKTTGKEQALATINALKYLQYATISVPANGVLTVQIPGDFVFVETVTPASGDTNYVQLTVRPDSGNPTVRLPLAGCGVRFPQAFASLYLVNTNAQAMALSLYVGFGDVNVALGTFLSPIYTTTNTLTIESSEITRPNNVTPYAAGQVVGSSPAVDFLFQFAVLTAGQSFRLRQLSLYKSGATVANAVFRAYLIPNAGPAVADQVAFPVTYPSAGHWYNSNVAYTAIDFPFMASEGGGGGAQCTVQVDSPFNTYSPYTGFSIRLVAQAAYVPAALEKFLIVANIDRL